MLPTRGEATRPAGPSSSRDTRVKGTKVAASGEDVAGGGLPRTGFPVIPTVALGGGLVASGLAVRRYVHGIEVSGNARDALPGARTRGE